MDTYSSATSWVIFGTIVGVGVWYYYPRAGQKPSKAPPPTATGRRKRQEQDDRSKPDGSADSDSGRRADTPVQASRKVNSSDNLRKRKAESLQPAPTYAQVVQADEPEEDDMSTRKWAEGMVQTQKGYDIAAKKGKEARVKTVKQSTALHKDGSQPEEEAKDDGPTSVSQAPTSGDVSDMLEPAPSGPNTLRVTAPAKPQKEKTVSRPKEEIVETKKQRQNRQKAEERRLQREVEEEQRKKLQESQRRTAREARGEPAKNGIPLSKPPAVSAWSSSPSADVAATPTTVNGNQSAPLLDTFDAESISSSNGGMEPSTGPTSTTSSRAAQWDNDLPPEEEQMAQAMKQSEDESGWMTVGQPKKPKKKAETPLAEPMLSNKTNLQPSKSDANGKPKGFQALEVEYAQRTDADPNDASNWDA